jgi:hypothetical protein
MKDERVFGSRKELAKGLIKKIESEANKQI